MEQGIADSLLFQRGNDLLMKAQTVKSLIRDKKNGLVACLLADLANLIPEAEALGHFGLGNRNGLYDRSGDFPYGLSLNIKRHGSLPEQYTGFPAVLPFYKTIYLHQKQVNAPSIWKSAPVVNGLASLARYTAMA